MRQGAAAADAGSLLVVGKSLVALHNWTFLLGPGFADGVGTGLILGWLMYRSGLVSRRMAFFGVIGGPLLAASGIAVLLGVIPQGSLLQSVCDRAGDCLGGVPCLWLTFKRFRPSPIAAGDSRPVGMFLGCGHGCTWLIAFRTCSIEGPSLPRGGPVEKGIESRVRTAWLRSETVRAASRARNGQLAPETLEAPSMRARSCAQTAGCPGD